MPFCRARIVNTKSSCRTMVTPRGYCFSKVNSLKLQFKNYLMESEKENTEEKYWVVDFIFVWEEGKCFPDTPLDSLREVKAVTVRL